MLEETMGYKIKMVRVMNSQSKSKIAKLTGLSRSYISEIESGKYDNPSLNTILKLCKALECSPNDIIPKNYYK